MDGGRSLHDSETPHWLIFGDWAISVHYETLWLLFSWMRSLSSEYLLPARHYRQCLLRFSGRIESLIVVPKMVWVPFPSLISFCGQLATQDLRRPSLHLFVSFTDFWMNFVDFKQYWSNALTSSTLCLVCTSFCLVYTVSVTGSNIKDATRQLFLLSSLVRSELRWQPPKELKFGERKASVQMEMFVHFVLFRARSVPLLMHRCLVWWLKSVSQCWRQTCKTHYMESRICWLCVGHFSFLYFFLPTFFLSFLPSFLPSSIPFYVPSFIPFAGFRHRMARWLGPCL